MTTRLLVMGSGAAAEARNLYQELFDALASTPEAGGNLEEIDATGGLPVAKIAHDPSKALNEVVVSLRSAQSGIVVIEGLAATPVPSFDTVGWNLDVAAALGATVVYSLDAQGLSPELISQEIATFKARAAAHNATVAAVVLSGPHDPGTVDDGTLVLSTPLNEGDVQKILSPKVQAVTPLMFKTDLLERAGANKQRIVLPEAEDERILRATAELLSQGVADIILIGNVSEVTDKARDLGVNIEEATIVATSEPTLSEKYAAELARLREAKGMTLEQARETVADPTYFATMMVQMGDADGMVSGATHTTADTIRPAFQIIKTQPDVSLVSSAFLMLMADQVLVFADCAVVVSPDAAQLSQIALTSAETARQFGIDPKVAMLSYSTVGSGAGPSVDLVTEATNLVRQASPDLPVEGPIQFDAAVDPGVGQAKAPGSAVAGQATVLVFPDLNAGNIAYKAIQRSAGATAVGPVLQGLRKPVNDLSRGALVEDIVNTVAITAVQAQGQGSN